MVFVQQWMCLVNLLQKKDEAIDFVNQFLELLDTIENEKLDSNISTKPTQFGLNIDFDFCLEQYNKILTRAKQYNNYVRIDMEDSATTDKIIELYEKLYKKYPNKCWNSCSGLFA